MPAPATPSSDDLVRYFTAEDAPACPFTGARQAGWYWRTSPSTWDGPAPHGEEEARHHASAGSVSR